MDPQLDQIIESLLFASPEPIESKEIARLVRNVAKRQAAEEAEAAAEALQGSEYEDDEETELDAEEASSEEPLEEDAEDEAVDEVEAEEETEAEEESEEDEESEDADEPEGEDDEESDEETDSEEDEEDVDDGPPNLIKLSAAQVNKAIEKLNAYYENTGRAFAVVSRPNGWKLYSRPEFSPWLRELFPVKRSARLSPPALETLAIIAYRQPMTRAAIEAVRGVAVDGVVNTLVERGLIQVAGRADLPGRPLLYETTPLFFEHFNIRNIDDLPNAAELRQVKLPEPETEAVEDDEDAEEQEELDLEEDAKSDSEEDASDEEKAPEQEESENSEDDSDDDDDDDDDSDDDDDDDSDDEEE